MKKCEQALVSVTNKKGIVEFCRGLHQLGIRIISTGGTAALLKKEGIPLCLVSDYTGFPEILDGRVKTLHPKIHGGLLGVRDNEEHAQEMAKHDIRPIDLVVVNLYAFEEVIARGEVDIETAIENIDIGGPSMLRSAAKNYRDVAVVMSPSKYELVLEELRNNDNTISDELRLRLATEVFRLTSQYDQAIFNYLKGLSSPYTQEYPEQLDVSFKKVQALRYGENPHQKAAFYREIKAPDTSIAKAVQHHGKELSFNNIVDVDAAYELIKDFKVPAACVIKHTNPCGCASAHDLLTAYQKARDTDPVSAFGGIIGLNKIVDEATARAIAETFVEVVIAPEYSEEALSLLQQKTNLRLLSTSFDMSSMASQVIPKDYRKVSGGLLVQDKDTALENEESFQVVTQRHPTAEQMRSLAFAWHVAKYVKSNAIVLCQGTETVGVGAGQMSRIDSVVIACMKAQKPIAGCVMASDAFFPFRDAVDEAAKRGITAIVQPGGSVRDEEVIAACNEHDIAMVFTGKRHFKH